MDLLAQTRPAAVSETEVRRRLDSAIGRALTDRGFAARLLADPTVALGGAGCTPQQYVQLRGIRADTLAELADTALQLFWLGSPARPQPASALPMMAGLEAWS